MDAVAAFSTGFDIFYPVRFVAVALVLLGCRRAYVPLLDGIDLKSRLSPALLGAAVYVGWVVLVPVRSAMELSPMAALSEPWAIAWILVRCAGAVVIIPVVEELAFRGYLLRRLQGREFERSPSAD